MWGRIKKKYDLRNVFSKLKEIGFIHLRWTWFIEKEEGNKEIPRANASYSEEEVIDFLRNFYFKKDKEEREQRMEVLILPASKGRYFIFWREVL